MRGDRPFTARPNAAHLTCSAVSVRVRSGAGLSVDAELVTTTGGKGGSRTVTLQVGCDGIAVRDIGTRKVLRQFPYDAVAAWKHTEGEFHFFAMPQGVDKAIAAHQAGSKSGFDKWTLRTPRGAELTAQCKAAMEDLARGQANMETFERTLSTQRESLKSSGSGTPSGHRSLTSMISFRGGNRGSTSNAGSRGGSRESASSRRGSGESDSMSAGLARLDKSPMSSLSMSMSGKSDSAREVSGDRSAPIGRIMEGSRESLEDSPRCSTPREGDGPINAQI